MTFSVNLARILIILFCQSNTVLVVLMIANVPCYYCFVKNVFTFIVCIDDKRTIDDLNSHDHERCNRYIK